MTPTLDEVEQETYQQKVDDSSLIKAGTLTVAVDTEDAPQAMVVDGTTEGYAVDVAAALAEHMGLELNVVDGTSASDVLESGKADIMIGATSNDESSSIAVTGDYLENATAVFGKSDSTAGPVSASELNSSVIGVQESSASQEALSRSGITAEQKTYSNVNQCFEALASGEVDYVVSDSTAGAYLSRAYSGVSFRGVLSSTTVYGIAVSASNNDLLDNVSDVLDGLSADGTLSAIHAAWYGTLPMTYSDQAVSGVTIQQDDQGADSDSASDASAAQDEPADSETMNTLDS